MITSVIEGVVNWLIFPHQIFCHDLGRLEGILPLGVIKVPGLGKRRPLLHPFKIFFPTKYF